jgi:MurNAc alpha-1-phosphate uridylyltransferase
MSAPDTVMVLAAGLGTRMRPLTNDRPKALVTVRGRALIDHVLDGFVAAGVKRAVVNVHAFADMLEEHVLRRRDIEISISDERALLLETGGGLKHALPLLGPGPIWVRNIDTICIEHGAPSLDALAKAWNPETMDALLMTTRTDSALGFHESGDFFQGEDGRLRFKGDGETGPYVYVGAHITKLDLVRDGPDGPFSLTPIWRQIAPKGRLYGVAPRGTWMHVGDPDARAAAEARLAAEG